MARTRGNRDAVGDLFAHFGVEVAARVAPPAAVVEGFACPACGWLLRREEAASRAGAGEQAGRGGQQPGHPGVNQSSCPLCGADVTQPIRC